MAAVLSIEFHEDSAEFQERALASAGHRLIAAHAPEVASETVVKQTYDLVVLGPNMPQDARRELARAIREHHPGTPIIFLYEGQIRQAELADAVLSTTSGAQDFLYTVDYLLRRKAERNDRGARG